MKKIFLLGVMLSAFFTALCKDIVVKNATELKAANNNAQPGDNIILSDGVWDNVKMDFTCKGTASAPIIVKAENVGKVFIQGKSYLRLGGEYITVRGLIFTKGQAASGDVWEFRSGKKYGNNCRITQCKIDGFNNADKFDENYWIAFYGKQNRLDHNTFLNKTNIGVLLAVVLTDDACRLNDHNIDSNYFGIRKPLGSNGGEMIRIGVSQHCEFYSNTVVKDNLFENCDGETEIISVKSCGNAIRNNVFRECQGAVVLRHGNNNTIEGNVFLGNGKLGTGGVRVINEGNWVVNNFFSNCRGLDFRSPLSVMNGVPNSPANRYLPVRDAVIANNTYFNCTSFSLGEGADTERSMQPKNVFIFNNLFYNDVDTTLLHTYSNMDSVFLSHNVISKKYNMPSLPGFTSDYIRLQPFAGKFIPTTTSSAPVSFLPDYYLKMQDSRLRTPLSPVAGTSLKKKMQGMVDNSWMMGMTAEKKPTVEGNTFKVKRQNCKNEEELRAALLTPDRVDIMLTGKSYSLSAPLLTNGYKTISSKGLIKLTSKEELPNAFTMQENGNLILMNFNAELDGLNVKNFISTKDKGNVIHYSISAVRSSFSGLKANSFFLAEESSYADKILINNVIFRNNKANLFVLKDEKTDKGYYNVELMRIENCIIENQKGYLANLYRGGNDESTMGPKVFFTNNKITDADADAPLLRFYGVQYSLLQNNFFKNSNTNGAIVQYEDVVRGDHEQKNNSIINSGKIIDNKFVTNLK